MTRVALALAVALCGFARAAAVSPAIVHTPHDDARPVVEALRDALPEGLAGLSDDRIAAAWPDWVRGRDRAVRERLLRGEEDAVVNLLFFGTSFTRRPRLTAEAFSKKTAAETERVLAGRVADLAAAVLHAGGDERTALARSVLAPAGAPADRAAVEGRLRAAVVRVRDEQAAFAAELAAVRALPDATGQVAARSTIFRERGIALDTSLRPAFAVEEALRDALERGLLTEGSVRRVAVVGPGLDFVEKAEGQDFYPPQSLQALALADSLVRLGLANVDAPRSRRSTSARACSTTSPARGNGRRPARATFSSFPGPARAGRPRSSATGSASATRWGRRRRR